MRFIHHVTSVHLFFFLCAQQDLVFFNMMMRKKEGKISALLYNTDGWWSIHISIYYQCDRPALRHACSLLFPILCASHSSLRRSTMTLSGRKTKGSKFIHENSLQRAAALSPADIAARKKLQPAVRKVREEGKRVVFCELFVFVRREEGTGGGVLFRSELISFVGFLQQSIFSRGVQTFAD